VEFGDGTGACGACHGHGSDPTPNTPAHLAHARPTLSETIACSECHLVPVNVLEPGHLDHTVGAEVIFGPLSSARGAMPVIDASRTCSGVACHGVGLGGGSFTTPRWDATDHHARTCGACHGTPPPPPHADSADCGNVACHGAIVGPGPSITDVGRVLHVNGRIDVWGAP
jgi:predicted CxxxxCH...CXXCH cytochrome family protein